MTRKAMDKFLRGRDDKIDIPKEVDTLGIDPRMGKRYVVARCPYTPPKEHQNEQLAPKAPEPAFFGV